MQDKATISRLENIVGWIGSIILSIGLFLAAFLLAMDCANAESMANNIQSAVNEYLDEYFVDLDIRDSNIRSTIYNECPYVMIYPITLENAQYYIADFYYDANMSINQRTSNNYFYVNGYNLGYNNSNNGYIYTPNRPTQAFSNTGHCYRIVSGSNKSVKYIIRFNITNSVPQTTLYTDIYVLPSDKTTIYNNMSTAYSSNSIGTPFIVYTNKNGFNNGNHTYKYYENTIEPITNNTAGFDCYKLDTKGGIYFVADYSSLITFDHSTSNTSTFSCDVHLDDTIQTITLDSTSEYFLYDVDHREAEYSFPITSFVPDYTEYEHVWIDNVLVVNTYSGHGGSVNSNFAYLTPIDILGSFPEEELEPTIIPQVSPVPDNLEGYGIDYHSGDELKELYNNNMFNQWITESEFYNDIAELGGGRSVKLVGATDQNVYENNTDNTLAYLSNVAAILSGTADVPSTGAVMTVVYGVNAFFDTISAPRNNGQIDFNGAAEEYIRDNLYSSTYDIIVLEAYYDAEALQTNTNNLLYTPIPSIDDLHAGEPYAGKIFYVILTQRYIESLNLDGLGSLQKLLESDVYYMKATYEYLYDRLNDFEDKSLDGLKDIVGVNNEISGKLSNIDTFIQRIEGLLKKILDAILNLNIQPTDTTAIETKLDEIYTRLGNSNLNNDWYAGYRDWLYNETDNNVVDMPHEWFVDKLNDVKNIYDIFGNTDLHSYYTEMRKVISGIAGSSESYYFDLYFNTGIRSNDFDLHTFSSYNEGGFQ